MRTIIALFAALLTIISAPGRPLAAQSREERVQSVLARVAAYAHCREELSLAGDKGRRAELRERLAGMRVELERDGIDYESFLRVRGTCDDIMGDWFFDGAWIDNTFYAPVARFLNLPRTVRRLAGFPKRADDLTASGEIPDSAFFFANDVAAVTPEELREGDKLVQPRGKITITRTKKEGQSKGFYGSDERGGEYIFIVDPPGMEEQVTAAEVVGSTLVRMAGYNIARSAICTIEGTGNPEFDGRRAVATRLVEGYTGHWSYGAFRNRREIRACMLFAEWIHNTDWVDHNTGVSVTKVDGAPLVRYFVFDFGGSLGSWNIRTKEPRDGWENYVSVHEFLLWPLLRPLTLAGVRRLPYAEKGVPYSEAVGCFDANFSPARYRPNYPNMAWDELTRDDALWAARIIASYREEQIRTAVDLARYRRPGDADYVFRTLLERRRLILDYYGIPR